MMQRFWQFNLASIIKLGLNFINEIQVFYD